MASCVRGVCWSLMGTFGLTTRYPGAGRQESRPGVALLHLVSLAAQYPNIRPTVNGTNVVDDTLVCTLVFAAVLIGIRYRIETLLDAKLHATEPAPIIPTTGEPEAVP